MKSDIHSSILGLAAFGIVTDPEEFVNMQRAADGAPILVPTISAEYAELGAKPIHYTLDSKGNVLIAGKKYLRRGKEVLILSEEFGAGNIMDTYYRIYYLDKELEKRFDVVEARGGMMSAPVYQSQFEPIEEE